MSDIVMYSQNFCSDNTLDLLDSKELIYNLVIIFENPKT